jgi:hypothetical protein
LYVEARRQFVEKKFMRDPHRARVVAQISAS